MFIRFKFNFLVFYQLLPLAREIGKLLSYNGISHADDFSGASVGNYYLPLLYLLLSRSPLS